MTNYTSNPKAFYNERYAADYMEEWPAWKTDRVVELVRSLKLPHSGAALDFGCGPGVFTDVLCRALPGWTIYGADISNVAVEKARRRVSGAKFFVLGAPDAPQCDFVFSHHVLEHVQDLSETCRELDHLLKPTAHMLHINPCGNPGSLEHDLARLVQGGIDPAAGNRFYFEDVGHVRRLTTDEMCAAVRPFGFELAAECYANQRAGAVRWITAGPPRAVRAVADVGRARDANAARVLRRLQRRLLWICRMRRFAQNYDGWRMRAPRHWRHWLALCGGLPLRLVAAAVAARMHHQADREWATRRHDRRGSEMYLYFSRGANPQR